MAGFRLDAVDTLFEDPDLRDNPVLPGTNEASAIPNTEHKYNRKLPESSRRLLQTLRTVADEYDAVLIGETWTKNIDELKQYYGGHNNELQMPMDFMFTRVDKSRPPSSAARSLPPTASGGWPVYVLSNHDIVAIV